ncbi:N-acetyltransferase [Rhizobium leguminosarum bv. trifolii]|uniref:N-acetyltransferase n=1 Tax=Rhizobium leguminosarum bv. trifolii TaxID=386 RepID=A0A3E1B7Q2_RHILT|nr:MULTISPECIES: GNAT family N-acetyltransferase [Rhizobium]ANM12775.1 GCN5-related N-acetyltransferase protein [Rhizobium sp. N324]ANM19177.1 GCN5-related N-acetyltransferase protein [Rhizobium sp. N541]ANM25562.1 GCN5-related N-acetyltransferase protein [Rhizobium sp. N941]OYD01950.1 GCN5-related N-acetyltransferase protein [Rhizobium sp. N4311]RFB87189.1 N-acetyltransferase [Rhizobium leguminosarum bv. trifolii]
MPDRFSFVPATADRLTDIEMVFDDCGGGRNCRCADWYLPNADFKAGWGEGNRSWFRDLLDGPRPPGILGYQGNDPAGWCGVAPRAVFDRLRRSKPFAPVDERPVWSINCFITRKPFRRQGLSRLLLKQAVEFARVNGAECLEAYPVDQGRTLGTGELYPGTLSIFLDAGFAEVARRLPTRPIVRLDCR